MVSLGIGRIVVLGGQIDGSLEREWSVPLQGIRSVECEQMVAGWESCLSYLSVTNNNQYSRLLLDDSAASNCW